MNGCYLWSIIDPEQSLILRKIGRSPSLCAAKAKEISVSQRFGTSFLA